MKVLLIDQIATVNYKYSYSLANALKQCGNDVELVIDDKENNDYCVCRLHRKFNTARKDVNKIQKLINYCQSYGYILREAIKEKFDVIHAEWFQFSPIDYFYLKRMKNKGMKVVISVHDILPFNEMFYDKFFHKRIYSLADHIIVQAENNIKRMNQLFPGCENKLSYIPHGHFLDFAEVYEKKSARKYLGVSQDKTVLLFFGQIKKVKGVGVLLEAFGRIVQEREDLFLLIAGNAWKDDLNYYEDIIRKYNLTEEKLKFDAKYIPDEEIGYYYSACDLAILPYLDVYQSGVIQLVYAYEKPAVVTNLKSFTEVVTDGINGFVCEKESVKSLQETIIRAVDAKQQFEEMGRNGKQIIMEKFSWEKIAREITAIYEEIK